MPVTIARGVLSRIRQFSGAITLQAGEPSDARLAAEVLGACRQEILDLDGGVGSAYGLGPEDRNNPKWVSDVIEVPSGPVLMVDGGFTPARLLAQIPRIVASRLEAAGVSAVVRWPKSNDALEQLYQSSRAVFLRLYPPPMRRKGMRVEMPQPWLQEGARWVLDGADGDEEVLCSVQAVEFGARMQNVASLLAVWERDRPGYTIICAGDPASSIRGIGVDFARTDRLELALVAGGPRTSDDGLLRIAGELQLIARRLAPTMAYAFVSIEPTFAQLMSLGHSTEWHEQMGGASPSITQWVCDEMVVDAFPYQVLGSMHVERLGGPPADAAVVADGRWELAIGTPRDWSLVDDIDSGSLGVSPAQSRRDPTVQTRARELLRACLLSSDDALALMSERLTAHPR